jgi:hypothetical protein
MSGDEPGVIGITQRDLLLEMRGDIRGLTAPGSMHIRGCRVTMAAPDMRLRQIG